MRQASESVRRLAEMGVVKLTVGGTEVNIEEVNLHMYNKLIMSSLDTVCYISAA